MQTDVLPRVDVAHRPAPLVIESPILAQSAVAVERELRWRALRDHDKCFGYFPALAGTAGIVSDLPSCQKLATGVPQITYGRLMYRFSFLRLSLIQQSNSPEFHLDSDAATALTGDVDTIGQRLVLRMLLNLSESSERTLHYLDVDPTSMKLVVRGGYVTIASTESLSEKMRTVVIPPRHGTSIHGLVFVANRVLHSGVDDERSHFVAAYGTETIDPAAA
jgi:hypothetical protein